jgi:S1-C subfamily serine protease
MTRARARLAVAGALAIGLGGCATAGAPAGPPPGAALVESGAVAEAAGPPPAAPATCDARLGADRLRRSAIVRAVDAGLGIWLQTVSVDPKLDRGRFRGWIVRSLRPGDICYRDIDLRADDVVTRVNGRSVEHPEDAHEVWVGLRTSRELVVDFLRADQAHTLRFTIVDQ